MEGFSGIEEYSSEDIASWLSASEDEVDIVGEDTLDESAEEDYSGGHLPSVPLSPPVECTGFSRASWVNLEVVLLNDGGIAVAEGICHNTNP